MLNDEAFCEPSDFIIYHSSFIINPNLDMFKRLFPGLVISSLVIAGVVWGQISGRAFEQETPRVPIRAEARPGTYELPLNSAVALQLFALERHARVDMILYGSGSSGWQLASIASAPTVVALGVSTGR